jgi:hypothetical protein
MLTVVPCRACAAPVIRGVLEQGVFIYVNATWAKLGQYVFIRDDCLAPDPMGHVWGRHYYRHRCHG